jgi:hypothetical protein
MFFADCAALFSHEPSTGALQSAQEHASLFRLFPRHPYWSGLQRTHLIFQWRKHGTSYGRLVPAGAHRITVNAEDIPVVVTSAIARGVTVAAADLMRRATRRPAG